MQKRQDAETGSAMKIFASRLQGCLLVTNCSPTGSQRLYSLHPHRACWQLVPDPVLAALRWLLAGEGQQGAVSPHKQHTSTVPASWHGQALLAAPRIGRVQ